MHERRFIINTKINQRLGSKALKTGSTFLQQIAISEWDHNWLPFT